MKSLRMLSLAAAIGLAAFALSLVLFAIFDAKFLCVPWRSVVAQFQTFLGGLSVLSASLFAYHGNTAMVEEVCRKNAKEEEQLRLNILMKAALAAEMIRQQSHARLCEIKKFSSNFESMTIHISLYGTLQVTMPEQWLDVWDNLSVFPEEILSDVTKITNFLQIYISEYAQYMNHHEKSTAQLKSARDEMNKILAGIDDPLDAKNSQLLETLQLTIKNTEEELYKYNWRRAGNLLEEVNKSSLNIMKSLPLTKDWTPEKAPYPPQQESVLL